jgi:MFS family permease
MEVGEGLIISIRARHSIFLLLAKLFNRMTPIKSNIWKMYLFRFFISLHLIGGVLVPFFLNYGHISFFQIMLLQSWFILWVMIFEIPTGAIGDHLGRKPTLIIAAIVNAIGVLIYSSVPNFYVFMLGEFLWAFASATGSGTDESLVYDTLKVIKQERTSKKILGRFESIGMIGIMIAAPIGSFIAASLGLRWAMLLMAIPFTMAAITAFTLKEPIIRKINEGSRYLKTLMKGAKYFYSHKILRILAFDAVIIEILIFFIIWLYQPKLMQLQFNIAYFGIVLALMSGLEALIMNNFRFLEKIVGSKKMYLLLTALIPGICLILLGLTSNITLSIILIVLTGGLGLSRWILFSNYMHKYIKSSNRATVMSTIFMFQTLGMGITYPLVGLLVGWSLSYTLIIIGILTVAVAIISKVEENHLID